ncbi:MAG: protein kinase domain-containing protein [Planctomycetota bacterium]
MPTDPRGVGTDLHPDTQTSLGSGLSSSDPGSGGRFLPGTMIARRYRIVGLLGSGGMGEVYRADDLKLGQPVALKFLPEELVGDPRRFEYFRNEVRLARQVSNPNVCRVYDIGEVGRRQFLSMEYIDGEDLATLIRRIGRLPADKGVDVARQLCDGLAAAHDRGILHRDLKPANVMLDARGRVRITDFGVACLADQPGPTAVRAGTPAYMAPEQLAGREVSQKSDLYSLGLVLFEVFTGKQAFQADSAAELARLREDSGPVHPSSIVPEIDPTVEAVILRCLENEPQDRPASVSALAAALPGGDPLAAAVALGETPSPEMVAAAGGSCALCTTVGATWLVAMVVGLVTATLLIDKATVLGRVHGQMKKPEALEDTASRILRNAGYEEPKRGGRAYGFAYDEEHLARLDRDRSPGRWDPLRTGQPAGVCFWYRESPRQLAPMVRFLPGGLVRSNVTQDDPPPLVRGMVRVRLDPQGRLQELEAVPHDAEQVPVSPGQPDWSMLFESAGLGLAEFTAVEPARLPPVYADGRVAWEGPVAGHDLRVRVEAASYRGRPVYFQVAWPEGSTSPGDRSAAQRITGSELTSPGAMTMYEMITLIVFVAAALLAKRNLRLGRSDPRGALKIGLFVFSCFLLSWLFGASHLPSLGRELQLLFPALGWSVYTSAYVFLVYLALEPYARRLWPETLISWNRLLAGRFRDTRVGRDLLVGVPVGVFWAVLLYLGVLTSYGLGAPAELERITELGTLLGTRHLVARLFYELEQSVIMGLYFLLAMLLLRSILRNQWLAGSAFVVIFTVMIGLGRESYVSWIVVAICWSSFVVVSIRCGLLAMIAAFFAFRLLTSLPVTADVGAWYWSSSLLALVVVAAVGLYGYYTSWAGRWIFGSARPGA